MPLKNRGFLICILPAGGIYHFRDQIKKGDTENFFVLNADVCCDFPLQEMLNSHLSHGDNYNNITIMGTKVSKASRTG